MVSDSTSGVAEKTTAHATASTAAVAAQSRHVFLLSLVLALAYLLTIVYASLQPFRNWRLPAADVYSFLTAPWPYFITLKDVLVNVAAYVPLGFMLALGLRLGMGPVVAVIAGLLLAVATSIAMESMQMFLPARIASNVDVLANSLGALIGALAAPLFLPSRALGARVGALRDRLFVPGALADIGLVLICLWLAAQLSPWAQAFATGDLRDTFDLSPLFTYTPVRLIATESAVVFFNVLGVGLLLSVLLRRGIRRGVAIGVAIAAALALKMLASVLLGKPQGLWAWVTPGTLLGLLVGSILIRGLITLRHGARLLLAFLSVAMALVSINLAPDNPYFSLPPQLTNGRTSHFLSFTSILRALSELWPLLALGYLVAALWQRRPR